MKKKKKKILVQFKLQRIATMIKIIFINVILYILRKHTWKKQLL